MSLMNDALRKKDRETSESPAANGFSDPTQGPRPTRRRGVLLASILLLAATGLAGIFLMQSATGNALLLTPPLTEHSQPPVTPAAVTVSSAEPHQADGAPLHASEGHQTERIPEAHPPKDNRLVTADPMPTPSSRAVDVPSADRRPGDAAPAIEPPYEKPEVSDVSNASESIEASLKPSSPETDDDARSLEPGPDQIDPPTETASAEPRSPRAPVRNAAGPARLTTTQRISGPGAGEAVPKRALADENENPFYKKARTYHRNGRLADAIRLYRQVLSSESNHPGAMLNLAAAAMQQGNYVDAQPLLNRLEGYTPRPPGVLLNQAIVSIGTGSPEKALVYLDKAAAAADASPWEIRFHRAVAFARMNRLSEALILYRKAEAERPDAPRLQFNLAVTCDGLGLYPEALTHYEAVLRTSSESSEADKESITQRIRVIRRYLDTARSPAKGQ